MAVNTVRKVFKDAPLLYRLRRSWEQQQQQQEEEEEEEEEGSVFLVEMRWHEILMLQIIFTFYI